MKLLIDMNLSPLWVATFTSAGYDAVHWSSVGDPRAADAEIAAWALANDCVIFTHDLDFSALLALAHAAGPSVIQIRTQDVFPSAIGPLITKSLKDFEVALSQGALISIDERRARVRILPLR
jgi:predicted nuclease of predicted toxin-antitoxin system